MRYFKIIEDGYITALGIGDIGQEIQKPEYNKIYVALMSQPEKEGYTYKLTEDVVWEQHEMDRELLTPKQTMDLYMDEILSSIQIQKKPKVKKKGYDLVQSYDPGSHTVVWNYVENGEPMDRGSYLEPIEWTPGMNIVAGTELDFSAESYQDDGWYIYEGLIQKCIRSGSPKSFTDSKYWEVVGIAANDTLFEEESINNEMNDMDL